MSVAPDWTLEELTDYIWALTRLLKWARPDQLSASAQASWQQVDDWLQRTEPLLRAEHQPHSALVILPFPLTATQLDALRRELSHTAPGAPRLPQNQAAGRIRSQAIHTTPAPTGRRLPHWRTVSRRRSSWTFIGVAAVLAAAWSWRARKR